MSMVLNLVEDIVFKIAAGIFYAFPIMWLWNEIVRYLIPALLPNATFWQAWGVVVFFHLLFNPAPTQPIDQE